MITTRFTIVTLTYEITITPYIVNFVIFAISVIVANFLDPGYVCHSIIEDKFQMRSKSHFFSIRMVVPFQFILNFSECGFMHKVKA